jgi:hypothetical protein
MESEKREHTARYEVQVTTCKGKITRDVPKSDIEKAIEQIGIAHDKIVHGSNQPCDKIYSIKGR